jgi:hypothetical protein
MRRVIFLLLISVQLHAQTEKPMVVWYDIDLADTSVNGLYEKNIPFFSNDTKKFIEGLWNEISLGKYKTYYRLNLNPTSTSFTFPIIGVDSMDLIRDYPPYAIYHDSNHVTYRYITLEHISKLRIYEVWNTSKWDINQKNYDKKFIAWSFILKPNLGFTTKDQKSKYESDRVPGEDENYAFNLIIGGGKYIYRGWQLEKKHFEPYIFLNDKSDIDIMKRHLNYSYQFLMHKIHIGPHNMENKPESHQKLVVYDMYFPDTCQVVNYQSGFHTYSVYPEELTMPLSRIPFFESLFNEVKLGKYSECYLSDHDLYQIPHNQEFPMISTDTVKYSPSAGGYNDLMDTIFPYQIDPSNVLGIRYYEVIDFKQKSLVTNKYRKKIVAWSLLLGDLVAIKKGYYDDIRYRIDATMASKYIFVTDPAYIPYLRQKLTQ